MIIYGSRTISSAAGTGGFYCPRCNIHRQYTHMTSRRWFTLYFIPLIPVYNVGGYIECSGCGGTYGEEAMQLQGPVDQSPSNDSGFNRDDIRRSLLLTLLTANRRSPAHFSHLQKLCHDMGMNEVSPRSLAEEESLARQAGAQLGPYVNTRLCNLTTEHRVALVKMAHQLLMIAPPLTDKDQQALRELAVGLQLPANMIDSIIRGS